MKQLRLKESLNNWSFWDKGYRLLVTCKATAFWRPRLCQFWLDFWVAKVRWLLVQICPAVFFLSTSQPQTPVINYSQRLHIPHKYRNYAGRMSSSALPKSNWSSSDSIYQLAKNNEKIMATTESTPSASRTWQFIWLIRARWTQFRSSNRL